MTVSKIWGNLDRVTASYNPGTRQFGLLIGWQEVPRVNNLPAHLVSAIAAKGPNRTRAGQYHPFRYWTCLQ